MSFEVVKKLNELRLLQIFGKARVVDWGEDSLPACLEMTEQILIQVLRLFLAWALRCSNWVTIVYLGNDWEQYHLTLIPSMSSIALW
jgi:hypothetical protein